MGAPRQASSARTEPAHANVTATTGGSWCETAVKQCNDHGKVSLYNKSVQQTKLSFEGWASGDALQVR